LNNAYIFCIYIFSSQFVKALNQATKGKGAFIWSMFFVLGAFLS
jgi:hypothetical protein